VVTAWYGLEHLFGLSGKHRKLCGTVVAKVVQRRIKFRLEFHEPHFVPHEPTRPTQPLAFHATSALQPSRAPVGRYCRLRPRRCGATLPDGPAIVNAHNKIAIVDDRSFAATERSVSNLDTFAACGPVLNKQYYGRLVKADQNAGTRENEKLLIQSFEST